MMLGQTDDSFAAVAADLYKMSMDTTTTANAVRGKLFSNAERNKRIIILATLLGFLISALVASIVGASIVGPIKSVTAAMQKLSAGMTDIEIGHRGRPDEIGKMVDAIDVFRKNMIEMRSMEQASHQDQQRRAVRAQSRNA